MAITIKKVSTKRELKKFIRFNYELYKENPYSVPDLYDDMLNTFNKKKNAAFEFCEAEYFLAYKDGKIVGRIAGIINHRANATWNKKDVRFGWIDFIDDLEVSSRLLQTVEEWGKSKGMENIQGPLGFTDFDAEGMLIEGFDQLAGFLGLGDGCEGEGGFTGGFRSVDFHGASAGEPAHAQGAVNEKVAGGDDIHFHFGIVAKTHDGVFTEVFLNLGQGKIKVALACSRQFFRFGR